MRKNKLKALGIILLLFLFLLLLVTKSPLLSKYYNAGDLIISEVMASNKTTYFTASGKHFDYIELYNGSNEDINLKGYFLSDNSFNTKKWMFPDVTIKAKDYLLVFASGLDKYEDGELHTNFKLKKDGEVIILSNDKAKTISKILYVNELDDTSFGYNEKEKSYVYYYSGTPLKVNDALYEKKPIELGSPYSITINEYIINNRDIKNEAGEVYPVIELYNYGKDKVNLKDFTLAKSNNEKYIFKDISMEPNTYLLIYLSGKDDEYNTNFTFTDSDNYLVFKDNKQNILNELNIKPTSPNYSYGLYNDVWHLYSEHSLGKENGKNFVKEDIKNNIVINEVSVNPEVIELKNISNNDINMKSYSMSNGGGKTFNFPDVTIKAGGFLLVYGSDNFVYDGNIYSGFHINRMKETIILYNNGNIVNEFKTTRLNDNISCGLLNDKVVIFKTKTIGGDNSQDIYSGYLNDVEYSNNNLYVANGTKITLSSIGDIYYTTDGTFPTRDSKKYTGELTITGDTIIKTIAYKDNYIESNVTSRTYLTGRKSTIPVVSLTGNYNDFFGGNGLITNYHANQYKKVGVEFYEADGSFGWNVLGDATMSGMDSRERDQKSIAIYMRKAYGTKDITYPLYKGAGIKTYSSFTLRNAGEDPKGIRIMDTALTYALRDVNLDIQDYRSVAVYINGSYYGHYNIRERYNGDYLESKYGIDKDHVSLMKFDAPKLGSYSGFQGIMNYIHTHSATDNNNYEYLKSQIDLEELATYEIIESFYGNTDLGNIRYYKADNGKWRWMLYDLDWSLWNLSIDYSYPVKNVKVPAATQHYKTIELNRYLYQNPNYKALYLKTFGDLLRNQLKPDNMNKIIDELAAEIDNEMPYHIAKWHDISSYDRWKNNVAKFKNTYTTRYNYVVSNLRSSFNLSNQEYNTYFSGL